MTTQRTKSIEISADQAKMLQIAADGRNIALACWPSTSAHNDFSRTIIQIILEIVDYDPDFMESLNYYSLTDYDHGDFVRHFVEICEDLYVKVKLCQPS